MQHYLNNKIFVFSIILALAIITYAIVRNEFENDEG
jgi:hypothetical protein